MWIVPLLLLALATASPATEKRGVPGVRGAHLRRIPTVQSSDGRLDVTLHVEAARRVLPHGVSFVTRTYNSSVPGPTLVVRPGDRVSITLSNRLESNSPQPGDDAPLNRFRSANSTNLHVHGIYDSPEHDNTFVAVDPGCSRTWHYTIDSGSGSQLLFYHPHFDGSQALQLFGGMHGAFVVVNPAHEALFAEWDTILLLLQAIDLDNIQKGSLMDSHVSSLPVDLENPLKLEGLMLLSNEQLAPRMPLKAGTPVRLRLVNAIAGAPNMLCVALQTGNLPAHPAAQSSSASDAQADHRHPRTRGEGGGGRTESRDAENLPDCTIDVLALDGIFLDEPRRQEYVLIPPGGRVELAVRCAKLKLNGPVELVTTSHQRTGSLNP
jgi:FtsP/CotA-like multicopper oxidase with cupredoxin domain